MPYARVAGSGTLALLVALIGAEAVTQTPSQFLSRTDLTRVDVTVLDRNRRPVRGLTAADFSIREDGRPQAIQAFSEIHVAEDEPSRAAWVRDVAPDVGTNAQPADQRLILILMDDATIPVDPWMVNSAKSIARGVIDRGGPGDLMAVVFTRDNRGAQNFTGDRERLLTAVDRFTSAGHNPARADALAEKSLFLSSVGTLRRAVEHLGRVPDRRKAIVFISIGVAIDMERVRSVSDTITPVLYDELQETIRLAERGFVNIFSVDPGGLDGVRSLMMRNANRPGHPDAAKLRAERSTALSWYYRDFLSIVSENTGGKAFFNTNEFETALSQISLELRSYYLLGYVSENQRADGTLRRIQVRVNRPGVTVHARRGYYASTAERRPLAAEAPPATLAAIAGLLPDSALPLSVSATPVAATKGRDHTVAMVLAPSAEALTDDEWEILATAYTPQGDQRAVERFTASVSSIHGDAGSRGGEILGRLALPAGRYELRIGVRSTAHQRTGSVYHYVDVPDYASDALSVSGPFLGVTPSTAGPKELFSDVLPFAPTLRRRFTASDQVTGFIRVHQGGSAPPRHAAMRVSILDGTGAAVFDLSRFVGSEEFGADRRCDHVFELPVGRLTPGPHMLTIEVSSGKASLVRHIRFERQ